MNTMIPRRFFWLFDLLLQVVAFLAAYRFSPFVQALFTPGGALALPWVQHNLVPPSESGPFPPISQFLWLVLATAPTAILLLELLGAYRSVHRSVARLLLSAIAPFMALSFVALGLFAVKEPSWSRLLFFLYGSLSAVFLTGFRFALFVWWRKRRDSGSFAKNVVIVGSPGALELLNDRFADKRLRADYRLYGYMQLRPDQAAPNGINAPCLGDIGQLGTIAVHQPIHEVIVAADDRDGQWLELIVRDCDYFRVALRVVPETLLNQPPQDLECPMQDDSLHLPAVVLRPHQANSDALFVKRMLDIVIAFCLLVLLSPLFLIVAIAIKITTWRLKVFYPWRVVGQNGVEFTGYKFTTMVEDADERKNDLLTHNEMTGPVFKIKNDPRVTPLGKFLRKYSLNELPQLWSVLKGDMSLVGPRPAGPHELVRYEFWHKRKLSVQSGVTCLWQVRGRNAISNFDDWVKMDLEYIDNWSLWLDIKIIFRTVWVVLLGTGS